MRAFRLPGIRRPGWPTAGRSAGARAGARPGAHRRGGDLHQPQRLGNPTGNTTVCPGRRAPTTGSPGAEFRYRRTGRGGRFNRHRLRTGRRGVRGQPCAQRRIRRVRRVLAHKPPELSFAEASVIPQSGAIALQGVEVSRALAPGGRYRWVGGSVPTLLQTVTLGSLLGPLTRRRIGVLAEREGPNQFRQLAERCVNGEIELHIDRRFTLSETPAPFLPRRRAGSGQGGGRRRPVGKALHSRRFTIVDFSLSNHSTRFVISITPLTAAGDNTCRC